MDAVLSPDTSVGTKVAVAARLRVNAHSGLFNIGLASRRRARVLHRERQLGWKDCQSLLGTPLRQLSIKIVGQVIGQVSI
ncbi:TPA: hypothetical protein ACH3X3_003570 [Trebouxia sp. C0006]